MTEHWSGRPKVPGHVLGYGTFPDWLIEATKTGALTWEPFPYETFHKAGPANKYVRSRMFQLVGPHPVNKVWVDEYTSDVFIGHGVYHTSVPELVEAIQKRVVRRGLAGDTQHIMMSVMSYMDERLKIMDLEQDDYEK